MNTKLEELRRKEKSYRSLYKHHVGTGLCSHETNIRLPLDSPNHNAFPIDSEWFRKALALNWDKILASLKIIAEEDIAKLKSEAIIEASKFLKSLNI